MDHPASLTDTPLAGDPGRLATLRAYDVLDSAPEPDFDDAVQLATLICEAPIALVSLVAHDRQWFKAQVGFPVPETDLDRSVCVHALNAPDLLVIEDLAQDPRTRLNPLVTAEPHIRFYAGAPLRTAAGAVLGTLCVIDNAPRPGGLRPNQASALRSLARQVMGQLDLRRAIAMRQQADARTAALLMLGDGLRDLASIPEMTRVASAIVGQALGATRVGFGRLSPDGAFVDIGPDWTAAGTASLAGRHRLDDYGSFRPLLQRGEAFAIADVRTDALTRSDPALLLSLGIGSMVNLPVRERGRVVSLLFVHNERTRAWSPEEMAFLANVADWIEVGVARLQAEAQQRILNEELGHRLKNTLAMVQAIATQTLRPVPGREPVEAFIQRLTALGRAHDILLHQTWAAAPIRTVVERALELHTDLQRYEIAGPDLSLEPRAVLSLMLLLHELATNAAKYGALSTERGSVALDWAFSTDAGDALVMTWRERGGPPVSAPTRKGLGSRLIGMGLAGAGGTVLDYRTDGLRAEFRAPLALLSQGNPPQ